MSDEAEKLCLHSSSDTRGSRMLSTKEGFVEVLDIMNTIYHNSVAAAKRNGLGYNLVAGANIAGFERVAEAMLEQGVF